MALEQLFQRRSLLSKFVRWLLLPLLLLWVINTIVAYQISNAAATLAYDRTLLASARSIGEKVTVQDGRLHVTVPYIALDNFEYDNRGQMFYRVTGLDGRFLAGYADLPAMPPDTPRTDLYPALVHFNNDHYRGHPIRLATFFKPVDEDGLQGMVRIEVAETTEARRFIAHHILSYTLWGQGVLVLFALAVVGVAMYRILRPIRKLGEEVSRRDPADFSDINVENTYNELLPLVDAINQYRRRLAQLLMRYQRFAADASHQLRTPLAVMTTQAEHALRDGSPAVMRESLQEQKQMLKRTTRLTNQLLLLAKMDSGSHQPQRGRPQPEFALLDCIEQLVMSRLAEARHKDIDLGLENRCRDQNAPIRGQQMLIEEVLRNLLDNALRHTPGGGIITLRLYDAAAGSGHGCIFEIEDSGPGIAPAQREQVFERFHQLPDAAPGGSGLGLAIVRDICRLQDIDISLHDGPQLGGLLVQLAFRA
ncbi:sensor histidine kinase [Vogesella oryzae]|uniref:sensor histidine kinase n=1 Tax=Vogesella oryzae TaxID=1735285 RepID=UPI001581EDBE|nr:sensor histidine kinase [Vogesella oryzae]